MLDVAPHTRLDANQHDSADSLASPRMPCGRNSAWCVAHTHPQAEHWADTNLRRAGYRTYLPLYAARRRDRVVRSMFHTVARPLFPSYLFVAIADGAPWVPARYAPGVHTLLMAGGKPQHVDAGAMAMLQATDEARRTHPTAPTAQWRPGLPVRVAKGIFQGHGGAVLEADSETVQVGLMFLGQLRTVALPAGYLMARDEA